MLGGSGMPSEDNLIRLYYTAEMAKKYDNAEIILVHPMDSAVNFKMKRELTGKGINKNRIMFEFHGTNTRSQALSLALHYPKTLNSKIVIISSTEHILRAVMTFKKAGFKNVGACPALEYDMSTDFRFNSKKLGGKSYIPDMGNNIKLRYNFWSYLKLEIICLREFSALGYYSLNGWI